MVHSQFESSFSVIVREVGGETLPVDEHGQIQCGHSLIAVRILLENEDPFEKSYAVMVDGNKAVTPKKELFQGSNRCFDLRLDLSRPLTAPANTMRLVRVRSNGQYEVVEIGVCCQRGAFFLVQQVVYEGQCYGHKGRIVIPRFDQPWSQYWGSNHWSAMSKFIVGLLIGLGTQPERLENISAFVPPVFSEPSEPTHGIVVFFNYALGAGVVRLQGGKFAYVSYQDIPQNGSPLRGLETNQKIIFGRCMKQDDHALPFKLEAIRVAH